MKLSTKPLVAGEEASLAPVLVPPAGLSNAKLAQSCSPVYLEVIANCCPHLRVPRIRGTHFRRLVKWSVDRSYGGQMVGQIVGQKSGQIVKWSTNYAPPAEIPLTGNMAPMR